MGTMTLPPTPKVSITAAELTEVYARLRLIVAKRYGAYCRYLGCDPDDLVHDAIRDTLIGNRTWPPIVQVTGEVNKDVSLLQFLSGVIRSVVSHRLKKAKRTGSLEALFTEPAGDYEADGQAKKNELADVVLELVADDKQLVRIVEVLREYPDSTPVQIAENLSVGIKQMRNAMKRLRRRVKVLKEENRNG
jgi:DNA-directed RNA polymerase specialized sigma24 family protein